MVTSSAASVLPLAVSALCIVFSLFAIYAAMHSSLIPGAAGAGTLHSSSVLLFVYLTLLA